MSRQGLIFALCGLAIVAALLSGTLFVTRNNHLDLTGKVTNVRTLGLDERSSLLVADFRVENPTDVQFVVKDVTARVTAADGSQPEGNYVADRDLQRILDYYAPQIGSRQHPTLMVRDKINPHQNLERMIGVRYDVPEDVLKARKALAIELKDVDGTVATVK